MAAPNRWRRVLTWGLLGLVLLAVGVFIAGRYYLSSHAAEMVKGAFESQLKTRVEVDSARIGRFGDSQARGLRLYEPGREQAFLEADRVRMDVSAWGALRGQRS